MVALKGVPMLAPLPRLHRVVLTLLVLALGISGGVAAAQVWGFSLPVGGLLVGSLAGLGMGYLLVHDFHHEPRPARVLRRR
jgi:hypothetical protein